MGKNREGILKSVGLHYLRDVTTGHIEMDSSCSWDKSIWELQLWPYGANIIRNGVFLFFLCLPLPFVTLITKFILLMEGSKKNTRVKIIRKERGLILLPRGLSFDRPCRFNVVAVVSYQSPYVHLFCIVLKTPLLFFFH